MEVGTLCLYSYPSFSWLTIKTRSSFLCLSGGKEKYLILCQGRRLFCLIFPSPKGGNIGMGPIGVGLMHCLHKTRGLFNLLSVESAYVCFVLFLGRSLRLFLAANRNIAKKPYSRA